MNLFDSSFLCLDIGTSGVRGVAHRVRNGAIDNQAIFAVENTDTVYALKAVVDELEQKIGRHFDSAYITGNFGTAQFSIKPYRTQWPTEHRITQSDVNELIAQIRTPENYQPVHIIPIQFKVCGTTTIDTPIGYTDKQITSVFSAIFYNCHGFKEIQSILRRAHLQAECFIDSHFVQNTFIDDAPRKLLIDLGHQFTTASLWTARGPMWYIKIPHGGAEINKNIAATLNISVAEADRIKRTVSTMIPSDMDRFTPADTAYAFSCADVNDIIIPHIVNIIAQIRESGNETIAKYKPTKLILSGGGAEIANITKFFENTFSIPVQNLRSDGAVLALANHIWRQEDGHVRAYLARQQRWRNVKKKIKSLFIRTRHNRRPRFIPIMPSTLCFDMRRPETYLLFAAGNISMIHVDIMDGLYVNKIAGDTTDIKFIREHTRAHLHIHLMTESPDVLAADAIAAGANTVIVSPRTSGSVRAIRLVRAAGRRAGVALNPENTVSMLDKILPELDEVMVMTVSPGAAGQEFDKECVKKISELYEIRRARGLKFKISVDGGINDKTAQLCWAAGVDFLVSGSYLKQSTDFPLAVQSLLPHRDK